MNDSPELESLFEQTLARQPAPVSNKPVASKNSSESDSPELEALFEQAQSNALKQPTVIDKPADLEEKPEHTDDLYERIGSLSRKLHDALQQIGHGDALASANHLLPESRERLGFIAKLMEDSAVKVLNTSELQMQLLDTQMSLVAEQQRLWERLFGGQMQLEEFKILARNTPATLRALHTALSASKEAFLQIVMAQDFQDLAGQTLSKITKHVTELEKDLLQLMAFAAVEPARKERIEEFLAGPQFKAPSGIDTGAVSGQAEVDDLLKDLGF